MQLTPGRVAGCHDHGFLTPPGLPSAGAVAALEAAMERVVQRDGDEARGSVLRGTGGAGGGPRALVRCDFRLMDATPRRP